MAVKLGAITDWTRVDKGNSLVLLGTKYRKIRIDVATFIQTTFLLWTEAGKTAFPLGTIKGQGTIEFWHTGDCYIDGDANFFYRTSDGQETHVVLPDAVPFTRPANRRERNREQELIEYRMYHNHNMRMAKLEVEFRRKMDKLGVDPETGEVIRDDKRSDAPHGDPKGKKRAPDKAGAGQGQGGDGSDGDGGGTGDRSGQRPAGDDEQSPPADA